MVKKITKKWKELLKKAGMRIRLILIWIRILGFVLESSGSESGSYIVTLVWFFYGATRWIQVNFVYYCISNLFLSLNNEKKQILFIINLVYCWCQLKFIFVLMWKELFLSLTKKSKFFLCKAVKKWKFTLNVSVYKSISGSGSGSATMKKRLWTKICQIGSFGERGLFKKSISVKFTNTILNVLYRIHINVSYDN